MKANKFWYLETPFSFQFSGIYAQMFVPVKNVLVCKELANDKLEAYTPNSYA